MPAGTEGDQQAGLHEPHDVGGQVGLDLQLAIVHHLEGGLARVQHLARLDQAPGHLAGEGRHDAGLLQTEAGHPQVAFRGLDGGPGRVERGLGLLGRLSGDAALLQQGDGPVVVPLGLQRLGLGLGQLGFGGLHTQQVVVLVLGAEQGPGGDGIPLLHRHAGHAARDLAFEFGTVHRKEVAGKGHGGTEGAFLHRH